MMNHYIIYILLSFYNNFNLISNENLFYEIKYDFSQTIEIDENLRKSYTPEILEQVIGASNQYYKFVLHTNENESLIKFLPRVINSQQDMEVEIEPDLKWVYKNLKENQIVNLIEFNKQYYVKNQMEKLNWLETIEQKEILDIKTKKYYYEDENQLIEIWCAQDIMIANGPLNYSGNETLVLESTIYNKRGAKLSYHFIATKINYPVQFDLKKEMPKKIINQQEFENIFAEHREKEKEMYEEIDKD